MGAAGWRWGRWAFGFAVGVAATCGIGCAALATSPWGQVLLLVFEEPDAAELETADQALAWLARHPDDVGLIVATVGPDGALLAEGGLRWNADVPRPLASAQKVVHLLAYAQAVADGRLLPETRLPRASWEARYVEGTDGGAHPSAVGRLGLGEGEDPTWDQVASAMIVDSDNAATDLMLDELGAETVERARASLGDGIEPVHPLVGDMLMAEAGDACATPRTEAQALAATRAAAWLEDPRPIDLPGPSAQREQLGCVITRGSPEALATLHARVVTGQGMAPAAAEVMRRHLEWPMRKQGNQARFERFGAKGGSVSGVLVDAFYLVPKQGPFAGQPRVVVLAAERMSFTAWLTLQQSFAHQDLMIGLATDPAQVEAARAALGG